ncbi:MAG TPA: hypothetical protein VID75_00525 [Acidimicrobiales bacterium]|jgi:hypothetical protein
MSHDHLSDEQLSAVIDSGADGEPAAADVLGSISSCARCRQRLAALEQARALVRAPVTAVSPAVKAAAVRAALSGAGSPETAGSETARTETAGTDTPWTDTAAVVPMASARRAPRRSRVPVGAAAAIVALGLAVGIPAALSHGGSSPTNAAAKAVTGRHRASAPSAPETTEGTPTASSTTGSAAVTELGPIGSPAALRSRLAAVLKVKSATGQFGSSAVSPQSDSLAAPAAQGAGLPAPSAACVAKARTAAGASGPPTLVAGLTYAGTPALAVVFSVPPATGSTTTRHIALVVALSDCRTLARTTF